MAFKIFWIFSFFALFTNFLQWTSLQLVFTKSGFSGISPSQQARDLNASYANGLEQGKANSIHNSNLGLTWETSGFLLVEASTKYCFVLDECMSLNFIRDFKPRFWNLFIEVISIRVSLRADKFFRSLWTRPDRTLERARTAVRCHWVDKSSPPKSRDLLH